MATGNDRYLTDIDIRVYMRDLDGSLNKLLDDFEFTPEELRTAQTLTVDAWNEMIPDTGYMEYTDFPYRHALLKGTAANLLFIAAHRYRRNDLQYNLSGASVAPEHKASEYDAAGQRLWDEYKTWAMGKKRALNIELGFVADLA